MWGMVMVAYLGRFRNVVVSSSLVMAAAASGDMGPRTEPAAVTKQERTAVCAVVGQIVGWWNSDDRARQQARAGTVVAVAARARAPASLAASSQRSSRSHLGKMSKIANGA